MRSGNFMLLFPKIEIEIRIILRFLSWITIMAKRMNDLSLNVISE
jgi:hypothetical protein